MSEITQTSEIESAEIETQTDSQETGVTLDQSTENVEAQDSGQDTPEAIEEEKQKKRNSFQERINQKTQQAREANQRAAEAEQRAQQLQAQLSQTQALGNPPTLEQFDYDQDQYQSAFAQYNAMLNAATIQYQMAQQEQQQAYQARQQSEQARIGAFQESAQQFAMEHDDFQEVVTNPNIPIGPVTAQAIVELPNGTAVAYHLGKNPQLAAEIDQMSPFQIIAKLGAISDSLSRPVGPRQTNAPAPTRKLSGGSASTTKDPEKMTPEEYRKFRGYV